MSTEASRERPLYRNHAVFRSAERLLASRPRKRPRPWQKRSFLFAAGLICGLGIAFLRPHFMRNDVSGTLKEVSAPGAMTTPRESAVSLSSSASAPVPVLGSVSPARAPDALKQTVSRLAATTAAAATPRAEAPLPSSSSPRMATESSTPSTTILTRVTTQLKLRGHLHTASGVTTAIEFELNLGPAGSGAPVHGLVRFVDDPAQPDVRQVSGTWRGRTLTLEQTDASTADGRRVYGLRTFVLDFPQSRAGDITGRWSHQTSLGISEGTLAVQVAIPF